MAVVTLTSAAGSPGVTTTAVGLATVWPRPVVLVEADPTGSSAVLAGFFRGELVPAASFADLVVSFRHGMLETDLPAALVTVPDTNASLLPGPTSHEQARGAVMVWDELRHVLAGLDATGQDVIVDLGRLGLVGSATAMLSSSDLVLLLARRTLPAVVAASSWAQVLGRDLGQGLPERVGLVTVGRGRPYAARECASALELPLVGSLPWDPAGAGVYSDGTVSAGRWWTRRPVLPAALTGLATRLVELMRGNHARLAGTTPGLPGGGGLP